MRNMLLSMLLFIGLLGGCSPKNLDKNVIDKQQAAYIRLTLGMAYLEMGDLPAARTNIERAMQYAPQDYRPQLGMALYLQSAGETELAELRYQQALQLAPDNGEVLNNYGAFLCGLGQYDAAQQYFERAERVDGLAGNVASLEQSGYCLLQAGQIDEAQKKLSRALKQDSKKGERLLKVSEQYFQLKKRAESLALLSVYRQALPASAESIWIQIQFAASDNRLDDVQRYGKQLARDFSQSKQYQLFLAHEY
ncbi:type IV pilus biogenesis/stability protein PilW [Pragia fontium]|uniref:Type IV pilus biogenesis/stability protein PilW n=1 Tax=Pragia fontium TaxID=82985 RepID=A0ABQ5LK29_9GAMM|nr:type IV pilus biogenesis/stability protein PilW [Pragia fontium]GKX63978.1 type IV pilus biogenesis/stability protein PilW [Pragia fontium]